MIKWEKKCILGEKKDGRRIMHARCCNITIFDCDATLYNILRA